MKKKIALLMVVTMVATVLPMNVFAASDSSINKTWKGTTTSYDNSGILKIELKDDILEGDAFMLKLDNNAVWAVKDEVAIAKQKVAVERLYETAPVIDNISDTKAEIVVINGLISDEEAIIDEGEGGTNSYTAEDIKNAENAKKALNKKLTALKSYEELLEVEIFDTTSVSDFAAVIDENELKLTASADVAAGTELLINLIITPEPGNSGAVSVSIIQGTAAVTERKHKIIQGNKAGVVFKSDEKSSITFEEELMGSFSENKEKNIIVTISGSQATFKDGEVAITNLKNVTLNSTDVVDVEASGKSNKTIEIEGLIDDSESSAFAGKFTLDFADVMEISNRDFQGKIFAHVEGLGASKEKVVIYDSAKFIEIVTIEVPEDAVESDSGRVEIMGSPVTLTESVDGGFTGRYIKFELSEGATWDLTTVYEEDADGKVTDVVDYRYVTTEFDLSDEIIVANIDKYNPSVIYLDKPEMKTVINNDEVDVLNFVPVINVNGSVDGDVTVKISGPGVIFPNNKAVKEVVVLEASAPVTFETEVTHVRAGQTHNQTADIVIKENHVEALTIGEYQLSISTGSISNSTMYLNGVSERKSFTDDASGLVIENIELNSETNTVKFDVVETSVDRPGTITIGGLVLFTDGTVPTSDIRYGITFSNTSITNEDAMSIGTEAPYILVSNLVEDKKVSVLNNDVVFTIGSTSVSVNGELAPSQALVAPYVNENGSTMIPVRALSTALGLVSDDIIWNGVDKSVTLMLPSGKIVRFQVGSSEVLINGVSVPLINSASGKADPVVNKNGTTFLPLRFVAERVFEVEVEWDGASRTATFNPSK